MSTEQKTNQAQEKKKSKFALELQKTAKELRASRADLIAERVESVFAQTVIEAENKVRDLKLQIANVEDISRVSCWDLTATKKDFDPEVWVKDLIDLHGQLALAEEELEIVNQVKNEWV